MLPDVSLWGIHPVTPILLGLYIYGIHLVRGARLYPMWKPSVTRETREDTPDEISAMPSLPRLCITFLLLLIGLGFAGWVLAPTANNMAVKTGLSQDGGRGLLTAVSTSIPELVTSIAAARRGSLDPGGGRYHWRQCLRYLVHGGLGHRLSTGVHLPHHDR